MAKLVPNIHDKCPRCKHALAEEDYPWAMGHVQTHEVICDHCGEAAVEREPFGDEMWVSLKLKVPASSVANS